MINVDFIGRLCADPELRTTTNGKSVCNLRIAVRTDAKGDDGKPISNFYNAVTWNGLAENCAKWLKKGNMVAGTGNLRQRDWTDRNGVSRTDTEIYVRDLEFVPTGEKNVAATSSGYTAPAPTPASAPAASVPGADDDLPF